MSAACAGHPRQEAIAATRTSGAALLRTDGTRLIMSSSCGPLTRWGSAASGSRSQLGLRLFDHGVGRAVGAGGGLRRNLAVHHVEMHRALIARARVAVATTARRRHDQPIATLKRRDALRIDRFLTAGAAHDVCAPVPSVGPACGSSGSAKMSLAT